MEGYCVKCKAKRMIKDGVESLTKNGRRMMKGVCPECGTKMNRIFRGAPDSKKDMNTAEQTAGQDE